MCFSLKKKKKQNQPINYKNSLYSRLKQCKNNISLTYSGKVLNFDKRK